MNKTIPYRKAAYVGSGLKTDNLRYDVKPIAKHKEDKKERGFRAGLAIDSLILFTEVGFRFSLGMTTLMNPALMPCRTRPAKSSGKQSSERHTTGMAARNIAADATIIFLRPKKSHSHPAVMDENNPPSNTAPTTWLICVSE